MRNLEGHALVRSSYEGLERLKTFDFFFLITQAVGNPFRFLFKINSHFLFENNSYIIFKILNMYAAL